MIETDYVFGTTTIYCDGNDCNCDECFDGFDGYPDIKQAIKEAEENGWTSKKIDGEWSHYCRDCS